MRKIQTFRIAFLAMALASLAFMIFTGLSMWKPVNEMLCKPLTKEFVQSSLAAVMADNFHQATGILSNVYEGPMPDLPLTKERWNNLKMNRENIMVTVSCQGAKPVLSYLDMSTVEKSQLQSIKSFHADSNPKGVESTPIMAMGTFKLPPLVISYSPEGKIADASKIKMGFIWALLDSHIRNWQPRGTYENPVLTLERQLHKERVRNIETIKAFSPFFAVLLVTCVLGLVLGFLEFRNQCTPPEGLSVRVRKQVGIPSLFKFVGAKDLSAVVRGYQKKSLELRKKENEQRLLAEQLRRRSTFSPVPVITPTAFQSPEAKWNRLLDTYTEVTAGVRTDREARQLYREAQKVFSESGYGKARNLLTKAIKRQKYVNSNPPPPIPDEEIPATNQEPVLSE
jgi:hypothetical protein